MITTKPFSSRNNTELARQIAFQVEHELAPFCRKVKCVSVSDNTYAYTTRIDLSVVSLFDEQTFACEFSAELMYTDKADMLKEMVGAIVREIISQIDIKEEVADGLLPVELLDRRDV